MAATTITAARLRSETCCGQPILASNGRRQAQPQLGKTSDCFALPSVIAWSEKSVRSKHMENLDDFSI